MICINCLTLIVPWEQNSLPEDLFFVTWLTCILQVMNKLKGRSAPQTPTSVEELAMSGRRSKRSMNGDVNSSSERRSNRGGGGGSSLDGETGSSNRSREEVRAAASHASRSSRAVAAAAVASPSINGEVIYASWAFCS